MNANTRRAPYDLPTPRSCPGAEFRMPLLWKEPTLADGATA